MKHIWLVALLLTACDTIHSVNAVPGKMDNLSNKMSGMSGTMDGMSDAVRLQALSLAKNDMLSKQNLLVPDSPAGMVDGGKQFGAHALPIELAEVEEAWMDDINQTQPDSSSNNTGGQPPADLTSKLERLKIAKFTALQVIEGFAPQKKIEQMVQEQIPNGRYVQAAYQVLMLRAVFIQGFRFGVALEGNNISNLGELKQAVKLTEDVEYIVRQPFASQIGIKTTMLVPADSVTATLDPHMTVQMWSQISGQAANISTKGMTAAQLAEFQQLQAKVASYNKYWQSH
jgi:hypothetical protein